jgi:hypothetical protein
MWTEKGWYRMAEQLGKIEKPEAEKFTGKRKLYLVPLIFCGEKALPDYVAKFNRYWQQVSDHISNLESKIGRVGHIYHESVWAGGEEGLKVMEKLSPPSGKIAKEKSQRGAVVERVEDRELADESMDWERFILMGFLSQKVAEQVSGNFVAAMKKRYEHIARKIDETLQGEEAGLLFIREGHMVQFSADIEVFSIAPPELDEIHRWQRERLAGQKEERTEETKKEGPKDERP